MRLPQLAWAICFAIATIGCAGAALAAGAAPVGNTISPVRSDHVVFIAPQQTASCALGQVATASVVGIPGETVGVRRKQVLVNGQPAAVLPASGVQSFATARLPAGRFFLLGTGATPGCDSRELGSISRSNVVGYTQVGLDARVGIVEQQLASRISAEKYVAGVYLVVVAFFILWLAIHTGKVSRLQREVAELRPDTREID